MPEPTLSLVAELTRIVGAGNVLTGDRATARYRQGCRVGSGSVAAVARPAGLVEFWRVARACVRADVSIIVQASNTGLTGGSTPDGENYPGGVVILSTTRIDGVHLVRDGEQVVCLAGTTLYTLEKVLHPIGREPHAVIGSSCLGASVVGGVCNNSGGALIQRGPAFTQLSLFGAVGEDGELRLVNHLGIDLGSDPEEMLSRVESGRFAAASVAPCNDHWAHDRSYAGHVRDIDSATPARFNADPRCLYEAAGSAGKLIVFAVRLDTFPAEGGTATFYIGTNAPGDLTAIRRRILGTFDALPIAGEYMHRDMFDVADRYGKDTFIAIERLGTGQLPALFAAKARIDAIVPGVSDRLMQMVGRLAPDHLPPRLRQYRDRFEHHLILKVSADAIEASRGLLRELLDGQAADFFECTPTEGTKAFLHRFVAAGAAIRYRTVHRTEVEDIAALDVALPRNAREWQERLPEELSRDVVHALYYGHFFCHVFHQDYILKKGVDPIVFEHRLCELLDARGAQYPAEHNVGHLYPAKPALERFYRKLDPRNQMNPGIGQTTRRRDWVGAAVPLDHTE